jgi:hypothetical protein
MTIGSGLAIVAIWISACILGNNERVNGLGFVLAIGAATFCTLCIATVH